MMRIRLIRHGEVHNPRGVLYGRLPRFGLSRKGVEQARSAGRYLRDRPITALFTSPLLRARQTAAEIVPNLNGMKMHTCSMLNEVCSPFEGMPGIEVDALEGDVYSGADACYEQPQDVLQRLQKFIWRERRRFSHHEIAAVTHGDVITFAALWAFGREPTPANKNRLLQSGLPEPYPAHASITTLSYETDRKDERPRVEYWRP